MSEQLQGKQQQLVQNIQLLDFMIGTVGKVHKDTEAKAQATLLEASNKKLLLLDELMKTISTLTLG